ncbi:phosphotransferase [Kineosporia babensis]|uniref:Phosphotransferase n=1 Tax=Kineosporia babensis TaxID=499548 RepID=A0A9X1SWK7_9ACTN|nr:phosphotransferase [Kineosporia babensis]MCD5314140.1 phosphotransferase [Kineosporia babensis]
MTDEVPLAGSVGNAGKVFRVGDTVRRPWRPHTPATHALLEHLAQVAPGVAPVPLGQDEQGREVLGWLAGDVAIPPFPAWSFEDFYLISLGRLLRRIHQALEGWQPPLGSVWASELTDPEGGPLIIHADICPENIVARDGAAIAVLDWEFAAPGRAVWDVVSTARLCVPFTHPSRHDPSVPPLGMAEMRRRLHVFLDAYGLSHEDRLAFPRVAAQRAEVGERFVRGRVAAGEEAFAARWATPEGEARLKAEKDWIAGLPDDVALTAGGRE